MVFEKDTSWYQAVECAVIASTDYTRPEPAIQEDCADLLDACAIRFISEKKPCEPEKARGIYVDCVERSRKREQDTGKYTVLATIGSCLGVLSAIVILLMFAASGFFWVFLLVGIAAILFVRNCNRYIRNAENRKKAVLLWNETVREPDRAQMEQALEQMEEILKSGKNKKG